MAIFDEYKCHFDAYKTACESDPILKSFDSSLQEKSKKVLDSIAATAKNGCVSFHGSHKEFYGHVVDVSQSVADFIVNSDSDVWKKEGLKTLVTAYFENTTKTLDYFHDVQSYVNQAELGQLTIRSAVRHFATESAKTDADYKIKYEKTLADLKKFEDMKDDLDAGKYRTHFDSVKKDQVSLLDQVTALKKQIEEEYRHAQECTTVANIVFGAVFAAVAVFAVVTFAFGGELVVCGLTVTAAEFGVAAGFAAPMEALGWTETYNKMLELEATLKKQKDILASEGESLEVNKDMMEMIAILAKDLVTIVERIKQYVDDAMAAEDEEQVAFDMNHINQNVNAFTKEIDVVGTAVADLSETIVKARIKVLKKIHG